ncbi:MAG: hypothetical protein J1F35_03955 [Erysipelotrichales bacterium]|nr:hypothetical protein [Erysipelotrichales bacterium]
MKNNEFDILITELAKCNKCLNLKDKSLINFYDADIAKNIPSIWTDWYGRLDSELFIIGQDWGPYQDMVSLYERFKNGEDFQDLIDSEKSLTKKKLFKYLCESASLENHECDLNNIYITNAIMCARSGSNYRGNNINLNHSTLCCSKYLVRQIDIVKPKVIVTLGYYPLKALASVFNFRIEDTLSKVLEKNDIIKADNYIIIPLYHPTAQISNDKQLERYRSIWRELGDVHE